MAQHSPVTDILLTSCSAHLPIQEDAHVATDLSSQTVPNTVYAVNVCDDTGQVATARACHPAITGRQGVVNGGSTIAPVYYDDVVLIFLEVCEEYR